MGRYFKNHLEFLEYQKRKQRDSTFAEQIVKEVELEQWNQFIEERQIIREVGMLI